MRMNFAFISSRGGRRRGGEKIENEMVYRVLARLSVGGKTFTGKRDPRRLLITVLGGKKRR